MNIFGYSTIREFNSENVSVGVFYRLFQFVILFYIIGIDLIKNKSYQSHESISSSVTTKVKGFGVVYDDFHDNDNSFYMFDDKRSPNTLSHQHRIFDSTDYVQPPIEHNSIFIMTSYKETKQSQQKCFEDVKKKHKRCNTGNDCLALFHKTASLFKGVPTGTCHQTKASIESNRTAGVCEIIGWCPVESMAHPEHHFIKHVEDFTIFIKNDIQFNRFHVKKRNILSNITNKYISTCKHSEADPYCPIFQVREILEKAEPNAKEREEMMIDGGIVQMEINWNCDLDWGVDYCFPKYSFVRHDLKNESAASGFNYRYAERYQINNIRYRNLVKAYGLRIFIVVNGKAGKFDFVPFLLTLGAGIGLLAIPSVVADLILLNCTGKRKMYQNYKESESELLRLAKKTQKINDCEDLKF